jgi:ketopantoate reductase
VRIFLVVVGPIGGHVAALFAEARHEVTVIVRGAHLPAIRNNGLRPVPRDGSEPRAQDLRATDDIRGPAPVLQPQAPV